MKSKQLNRAEYEDKILQLIKRAEMFLHWSKEFYELYDKKLKECNDQRQKQCFVNKKTVAYLVLHNVLYFFEAALLLNTLLKRNKNSSELSFENYFFATNSSAFEQQIEKVRQMYVTSKIGAVRNKIIAHKDYKNVGDPIFHFMNRINKKCIDDADKIIKKLKQITSKNFNEPLNNDMKDFFEDSHNFVVEAIIRGIE